LKKLFTYDFIDLEKKDGLWLKINVTLLKSTSSVGSKNVNIRKVNSIGSADHDITVVSRVL